MRRALSAWLDTCGSKLINSGRASIGERLYKWASAVEPNWSIPWYNLGLHTKNTGRWSESLRFNQRALELEPTDEAAWWNLGIAATALRNWSEARRAWKGYGIQLEDGVGEVRIPAITACLRLDRSGSEEVVWGRRLDPARMAILSVPLPESGHRFNDIVLNDGAANGTRVDKEGVEVPVFDELSIWKVSEYSTFRAKLRTSDDSAQENLVDLCLAHELGIEDWTTVRILCAKCSRGNPGPHECEAKPLEDGYRRFGFAAKRQEDLILVLNEWTAANPATHYQDLEIVLRAAVQ
jgi:hypothetical protein